MQIKASYKNIWDIAYPIIVGSCAQNFIGFTDIVFLGRVGEVEFGAAGYISIYFLAFVMIGFAISRGGQILIARRAGEGKKAEIGSITYNLFYIQMMVAAIAFVFLWVLSPYILALSLKSTEIYTACLEYIYYRSFGIFFSFFGFVLMALYTGIGRTKVIAYVTSVLFLSNVVLNYTLIFGKFGMPAMSIGGAGLASTLAEIIAFVFGIVYIVRDSALSEYALNKIHHFRSDIQKSLYKLSTPVVMQYAISMGGWFLLFSLIEGMGERALAISTLLKNVYTLYSIPAWGFASAANAVVSNIIGQKKYDQVFTAINRTAILSFISTFIICPTLIIFPETILSIFSPDAAVIQGSKPILFMLIGIILGGSISLIIFNGLIGTGAMLTALLIEIVTVTVYLGYAFIVVKVMHLELSHVWSAEFLYWVLLAIPAWVYLHSERWKRLRV